MRPTDEDGGRREAEPRPEGRGAVRFGEADTLRLRIGERV